MQGTFVNLCYTMENHAIATMMTYFGSTDHGLGTEVDRGQGGGTSRKNRLESPLNITSSFSLLKLRDLQRMLLDINLNNLKQINMCMGSIKIKKAYINSIQTPY